MPLIMITDDMANTAREIAHHELIHQTLSDGTTRPCRFCATSALLLGQALTTLVLVHDTQQEDRGGDDPEA